MLQLKTTKYKSFMSRSVFRGLTQVRCGIREYARGTGRNVRGFRVTGRAGIIRADLIVASVGRMMVNGSFTTPTPEFIADTGIG